VEWLGEVPSHWTVTGLKRAFSIAGGSTPKSDIEDYWGGDIPWITPGDLSKLSTKFISDTARKITASGLASCAASLSPAGSIVISTRAPIGSLAVTEIGASTNQGCKTLVVKDGVSATFGYYALSIATEQLNVRGKGSTFLEISADDLGAFALPFPPQSEQIAIAAFLDRETAKIDALIEEQRRLIALLKEKRQAVISHAVTKGLDPHAPLKDSGIEWLGEVPAHWTVTKFSRAIAFQEGPGIMAADFREEGIPLMRVAGASGRWASLDGCNYLDPEKVATRWKHFRLELGDLIISGSASMGTVCEVGAEAVGAVPYTGLIRLTPVDGATTRDFVRAVVGSSMFFTQIDLLKAGATIQHFGPTHLRQMIIALPPLAEQAAISSHVDKLNSRCSDLMQEAEQTIALLNERRAALISAAVTGKIDVRASAKVLPFPIERARARGLVGTEIIERSAGQPTFGRVKFQKVVFLAEGHVGISELEGSYLREAAGPLDRALIDDMESGAHRLAGIERDQPGGSGTTNTYRLGPERRAHRQELADWLGPDRTAKLDKLITDFADLSTRGAEAVATLYGVWNDALAEGASPSDDEIINGFLNDWHNEKRKKFRASDLPEWLGWMRRHGIVPNGSGPKSARQIGALL
jgi:type I restriction enzyme S subunit